MVLAVALLAGVGVPVDLLGLAALESWAKSAACNGSRESPNPASAAVNILVFIMMFLDHSGSEAPNYYRIIKLQAAASPVLCITVLSNNPR